MLHGAGADGGFLCYYCVIAAVAVVVVVIAITTATVVIHFVCGFCFGAVCL